MPLRYRLVLFLRRSFNTDTSCAHLKGRVSITVLPHLVFC